MEQKVQLLELNHRNILNKPEFASLTKQTSRLESLKYQINHLNEYLTVLTEDCERHSISIQAYLESLFDAAVKNAYEHCQSHKVQLITSNRSDLGDMQCNSALRLGKEANIPAPPKEIATAIISSLPPNDLIEKTEVSGPGFINVWICKKFVIKEIQKILKLGVQPPRQTKTYSVIIDMSSPNIAKEMHVGHLRSTIIGDSIARLLTFLGHRVLKLNHIGDWGTQFGMLIAHLKESHPIDDSIPPIADLQAFYKLAKIRFDQDEEFKQRAYAAVVQLQNNDPKHIKAWEHICEISRREFMKVYERLDIKDLVERGESFYQSRMQELVKNLDSNDLLIMDEGRKLLWPPGGEIPLTIVKSDGGFTYDTSDLAALLQRTHEEKADWILYVVDMGQGVHFKLFFAAAEHAGFFNSAVHRIEHVGFGVVLGEDRKKFKTRSGETVRLIDLLDEGLERSKNRLIEKGRDKELSEEEFKAAQEAIAYGCIKYADISHNRINDYIFSFDKMLDDKGNTAVYLLYAHTRIRSIVRNAGYTSEKLAKLATTEELAFDHPAEWRLAKALCKLPEILLRMQTDLLLHTLCDYLYDLSCIFTGFYDACYCIERDRETGDVIRINTSRLMLCEATAKVMKCGFDIIGLRTVEKM